MIDYSAVLVRRHPGREWVLNGNSYEGLTMLDGGEMPSKKSLEDAWPEVEREILAEEEAQKSARKNAITKLAALGLTDAEITALLGG